MATEIILAVATGVVEHTVGPIMLHISYPFKYKSNVENLDKQVNKLKAIRERVQHSIEEDRRNGKLIEKEVEEWLHKVEGITEKLVVERVEREERAKKMCFGFASCPNPKIRYQLSRKAEKEALAVAQLRAESEFAAISYRAVPRWMFVSGYEALQSRISVVKEIMDALMVADVNTIGVHGMGGVGKTTTVKQVAKQSMEEKLFDAVVMADVTQAPDVWKIQGQLADILGLKFEEESEWGRAGRLRERLKQEKSVLVVLDDLWETIDLEAVGIPSKDEHKGCKILLTSRERDVLLSGMGCQEDFGVDVLPKEEAWDLFKAMAGDDFEDLAVQSTAIEVEKECACLPVAIVTVAGALKSKGLSEWKKALRELRRPSSENFTGPLKAMYSSIELSYNHLESKELKSVFLLCSLMGYNPSIHNLLKYGTGLGLFPNVVSIEEAQDTIRSLLLKLSASCLLLDNDSSEQFAMHDVVRDVAISIAARDHQVFVANKEVELNRLDEDRQKRSTQIWLRCNAELLEGLECPDLELFQILNGNPDLKVPDNFFEGMPKLKVLNLANFSFSLLPLSLHLLNNLQTLCLDQSVLGDITIIGELKNLEILSFVKCSFKQLPRETSQLTKLKSLDLTDCSELEVIPQNVISKLSRLEELCMENSFHKWHPEGSNNASIAELENLTRLSNLGIHIRDPRVLLKDIFSERLQRYRIFIGDVWDWDGVYENLRTLKLKLDASTSQLEFGVQMLLKKTEDLYLLELHGVENIICELDRDGFPQLKHLHLQNSPDIQYVVDTTEGLQSNPFPVLESLVLDNLISLEKIYHGAVLNGQFPFRKLKVLEVENCYKLKHLFSFSLAPCFLQLQNVKVTVCPIMEDIVIEEREELDMNNEAINVIELTRLRSVSLQRLPQLRNFCSRRKASCLPQAHPNSLTTSKRSGEIISEDALRTPAPLFNRKMVFPNLEDLELRSISVEILWHYQLSEIAFSIQNLQRLFVDSCNGLKYIFSAAMVKSLLQLKHLSVSNCNSVEEIIVTEGLNEEEIISEMLFPQLDYIELIKLPKLTRFCTGYPIKCPLLKRLSIERCFKLNTFVSDFESATVSNEAPQINLEENCHNAIPLFNEKVVFPSLASIEISWARNMEKIWHNLLAEGSFCKLRSLKIEDCNKLVNIFPPNLLRRFQRLEVLEIISCHFLKEIFEVQELRGDETHASDAFQLRDLHLSSLYLLKHIWNKDPQGILKFQNLHSVIVHNCNALKNLFPLSIARELPQLETLWMNDCGVEHIVEEEDDGCEDPCFVFPQLKILMLKRLPKCRNFYSAKHTWQCPMLKSLAVADCGHVKIFGSKFLKFHKIHGEAQINDIQEPLFYVEKVISNLEELSLDGRDPTTSIIWSCQLPEKFYSTVKVLKLSEFQGISKAVPFGFLQRLRNLETLSIELSSFKNLFMGVDEEENLGLLSKLRNLTIYSVDDVRHLWEQDRQLVPILQNLGTLKVGFCDELVNLVPSLASFQDLTTLDVYSCNSLLHLIMSSTARSLGQLMKLRVAYCEMVTEIVAKEEDGTKDEIIFSRLEYVELVDLENLSSFCSGNYAFKFPSLKEMVVEKCPKMMMFSPGVSTTPKLLGVCWEKYSKHKVRWQGNLDTTIRYMYTEMVGCNSNESSWSHIRFSDFPQLKETWHVQPPLKVFNNLVSLTVDECPSFSIAIPSNVLQALSNLKYFTVSKCDSLEGVFDLVGLNADEGRHAWVLPNLISLKLLDLPRLRHIWNREPRGILDFKSLESLDVRNCGSLRNVFTTSIALGLVQLEKMVITNCAMMEEIITEERSGEAVLGTDKIIFPVLKMIIFESLPNVTCAYDHLGFPSLKLIRVDKCPKMKPFIHSFLREREPNSVNYKCHGVEQSELPRSEEKTSVHPSKKPSVEETAQPARRIYKVIKEDNGFRRRVRVLRKEVDSTQNQNSPSPIGGKSHIPVQVQMDIPATDKDELPPEQVPVSTSASLTNTTFCQELKFSFAAPRDVSKVLRKDNRVRRRVRVLRKKEPEITQLASGYLETSDEKDDHARDQFSPTPMDIVETCINLQVQKGPQMENLMNTSPAAASLLTSGSGNHTESQESSGVSSEAYIYSLALVKKLLVKSPAEVAISVDRLLLLSSLKSLKNCPLLNSQQQEIIQVYIENFNTLVSSHPFDELKTDWTSSIKLSIEDGKRSVAELKTSYEDLTSKTIALGAEKEALIKRLHEIDEEEDHITANKQCCYADLVNVTDKLETHMNALVEAEKQQREAKDKASYVDDSWAKFRSLFA